MFYRKNILDAKLNKRYVSISGFSGGTLEKCNDMEVSTKYADVSFNFDLSSGALKDGFGVKKWVMPNGKQPVLPSGTLPVKIYFYKKYDYENFERKDKIILYCQDNNFYGLDLYGESNVFTQIQNLTFSEQPIAINYKYNSEDVIIFSNKNKKMVVYNGETVSAVMDVPSITSMCFHYERLFVTTSEDSSYLWFSDDFDPTNWAISIDEAGFIDLQDQRGKLLKVISFLDYLYVFRSYGISRISAFGEQKDFKVTNLFVSSGKIIDGSIVCFGDRIIFLTENGFFRFDGVSTYKIMSNLEGKIDYQKGVFASVYNGKIFVRLNMFLNSDVSEKVIICYDCFSNSSYIIKDINSIDNQLIESDNYNNMLILKDGKGDIFELSKTCKDEELPLKKVWKSKLTDFGIKSKNKILTGITVYSESDITLKVTGDKTKTFLVNGNKNKAFQISAFIKGDLFSYEIISSKPNAKISKLVFTFLY